MAAINQVIVNYEVYKKGIFVPDFYARKTLEAARLGEYIPKTGRGRSSSKRQTCHASTRDSRFFN